MVEDIRRPAADEIFKDPQTGPAVNVAIFSSLRQRAYVQNATRPDQTFYEMIAEGLAKYPKGILAKRLGIGQRLLSFWIEEAKAAGEYDPELHREQIKKRKSDSMKAYWDRDEMAEKRKKVEEHGKSNKGKGLKYSELGENPGKILTVWIYAENLTIGEMAVRAKVDVETMRGWVKRIEPPDEPIKPKINTRNDKMIQVVEEGLERGIISRLEVARMKLLYPHAGWNMGLQKVADIFGVSRQAIFQSKEIVLARLRENGLI